MKMTKKTIAFSLVALALPIGVIAQNALPSTVWTCTAAGAVVTCATKADNAESARKTAAAAEVVLSRSTLVEHVPYVGTDPEATFQEMLRANGVKEVHKVQGRVYADACPYGVCTTEVTRTTNDAAGSSVSTTTTGRSGSASSTK
jgi:hypothetical protein